MLHPSYSEIMGKVNSNVEEGNEPVVNSRYSIVIAAAKRARQLIERENLDPEANAGVKPLSKAVEEIYNGDVCILPEEHEGDAVEVAAEDIEG